MDDVRVFGYCENCGVEIDESYKEYHVDDDGKVFCCVECAMDVHGITKVEV